MVVTGLKTFQYYDSIVPSVSPQCVQPAKSKLVSQDLTSIQDLFTLLLMNTLVSRLKNCTVHMVDDLGTDNIAIPIYTIYLGILIKENIFFFFFFTWHYKMSLLFMKSTPNVTAVLSALCNLLHAKIKVTLTH